MAFRPDPEFLSLSARLGKDRLRVQGPGGNTSVKQGGRMWVKASGTELADAETKPIFVEVDRDAALAEAHGAGDGSCKSTVIDPDGALRPSIETTFHAALEWSVVAHTHSIATIVHAISPQGRSDAARKLAGLPVAFVPYRKPGRPLTEAILAQTTADTQVLVLENHGLICCGNTSAEVSRLMDDVETRLALPEVGGSGDRPLGAPAAGYEWIVEANELALDDRLFDLAMAGSYYPDHVVFLGPAMTQTDDPNRPARLIEGHGALLRLDATPAQRAMLVCLRDVLVRLPQDWSVEPIGPEAEAALLDWDAEKYRQELARQNG
ncbi:MAG: class II aldolase/adducin family protein [Pseudomonadota bacterium]